MEQMICPKFTDEEMEYKGNKNYLKCYDKW